MNDLASCRAVIIVFAMDGCPYCDEFQPKLDREVKRFQAAGAPLVFYRGGPIARGQIPVLILDGASTDPQITAFADQYQVSGMPTTLLLTHNARPVKLEGALEDAQIYELLASAVVANR